MSKPYRRTSDGRWCVQIELPPGTDGKRRRKVVTDLTKQGAAAKAKDQRRDLDRTGDLPTSSPTLSLWLDAWLTTVSAKRVRPVTQVNRESDVRLHIKPAIGRYRLDKLTPAHVIRMHDAITTKGRSSTTALRCHRLLHVALRDAVRAGKVTRNVADGQFVDAPSAAVVETNLLTVAQTIAVLDAASRDPVFGARWAMSLLTGARRGEVLGLEWDRVDWDTGRMTLAWQLQRLRWEHGCTKGPTPVCGGKRGADCPARRFAIRAGFEARQVRGGLHLVRPKTKTSWRVVPIVPPFAAYLERLRDVTPDRSGLVFRDSGGLPIDPRDDGARWAALLQRAGVDHIRQHDARHGAATLMLTAGVDVKVIGAILGHSSAVMTRHYQHADDTMTRDALTRIGVMVTPARPELEATTG